jgi:citrate synthase
MTAYFVIPSEICGPLDADRLRLVNVVVAAHQRAARENNNASSAAMLNATFGSGRIENGIASAVLSIGGKHGPLEAARGTYEWATPSNIRSQIELNQMIPGFGNSFFKDRIDPAWQPVHDFILLSFPKMAERIGDLTRWVRTPTKRDLCPNAALYTAATCSECHFRRGTESLLFILARLPVWVDLATQVPSERRAASADDGTRSQGVSANA